jgi:nucleotide-binding universal stress UspA family protein
MRMRTILIPLDGSEMAEAAIAEACALPRPAASRLVLLRCASALSLPGTEMVDTQGYAVEEAEAYLEALKERLHEQGVRGIEAHVWYGPAATAIVEAAAVYQADLIVMTTHGRSGLGRVVVGSVAESVLRGTTVPILVLRAGGAPLERPAGHAAAAPVARSAATPDAAP